MEKRGTEIFSHAKGLNSKGQVDRRNLSTKGHGRRNLSTKGQVTIFIILGIVLLLATGLFFYLRTEEVKELPPIPVIENIPLEIAPIRLYTQECMDVVGERAVRLVGQQGGYVDTQPIVIKAAPTESDGIEFSPGSNYKIPYWWYLRGPNDCADNCLFSSQRPDLKTTENSIENQIEMYIEENLAECLDDFNPFLEQGYVVEPAGDIEALVIIGESVDIFLEYPLEITVNEFSGELNQYYTNLPVNLKRIYEMSTELTNAEIEYGYLETQTLNLLTHFSGVDSGKLPPKTESTFNYGSGIQWSVPAVKKNIESMLMTYIPGLQVPFTADYERISGSSIQEAIYAMEVPVNLDNSYNDLEVDFDYLAWWPIYFNAGDNGVIGPESANALFIAFGVQRYSTNYDISFPVVVTISDAEAFNGEGYDFLFALESNIRNNQKIDETFEGLEGISTFQPSLMCNPNQRNSGNITIVVSDGTKPIEDVAVSYICGEESCAIGQTDSEGKLVSKFSICLNGIVTFTKPNYFASAQLLTTNKEDVTIAGRMSEFIEQKIKIGKYLYSPEFDQLSLNPMALDANEKAMISLTRISGPGEDDVVAVAEIQDEGVLRLVPGTYEVSITLIKNETLIIPAEKREAGGVLGIISKDIEIPEIKIDDSYITGGAELNQETGYFVIGDELYSQEFIELNAIGFATPKSIEDLSEISEISKYSSRFRQQIEPR